MHSFFLPSPADFKDFVLPSMPVFIKFMVSRYFPLSGSWTVPEALELNLSTEFPLEATVYLCENI